MRRPAIEPERLPELLLHAISGLIGRDEADLTARQLAVFLICTLEEGPHTVRGLAAPIAGPAVDRHPRA